MRPQNLIVERQTPDFGKCFMGKYLSPWKWAEGDGEGGE